MKSHAHRFQYSDGVLIWLDGQRKGYLAGCPRYDGYTAINSRNTVLLRHHIVWYLHHGDVPAGHFIDHVNGDRSDDRIENLRLADLQQSARNVSAHRDNQTGLKGVSSAGGDRYRATIWNGERQEVLGYSKNPIDCAKLYNQRAQELFGEFAKLNDIPQVPDTKTAEFNIGQLVGPQGD